MSSHFQVESWLNFYQVKSSHFIVNKSTSSRFQVILGSSQVSWADTNDSQVWSDLSGNRNMVFPDITMSGKLERIEYNQI